MRRLAGIVAATTATSTAGDGRRFRADVWADNWFALSITGVPVGEDSVPITTERSFNAESIEFTATHPLTIAIEAKDFKEDDTGLEYIGTDRQQMGDGGIIAQITDLTTGEVVAATDGSWKSLVIHRAPLDTSCERSDDPTADCEAEIGNAPSNWTSEDFDDDTWAPATEWSEAAVDPKDGYTQIDWDEAAHLVWGSDLEVGNTVLLRSRAG